MSESSFLRRDHSLRFGLILASVVLLLHRDTASAQTTSLFHQPQYSAPPPSAGYRALPNPMASPSALAPQAGGATSSQDPTVAMAAPNSSPGADETPLNLAAASWTYQPAPPLRVYNKNDIVTIRVDEIARMLAEGDTEKRRTSLYTAILTDWIKISGGRLRPDPLPDGDPAVGGLSNDRSRNEGFVASRESLTFNIAATVVDIRPNGNLVLEARKSIRANDNVWETALTGECRAIDIGPDNVVLSKDLLDLEIHKEDQGQVRDNYKRGWFARWFDRVQPF